MPVALMVVVVATAEELPPPEVSVPVIIISETPHPLLCEAPGHDIVIVPSTGAIPVGP